MDPKKQDDVEASGASQEEYVTPPPSYSSPDSKEQDGPQRQSSVVVSAKLENPLAGMTREELMEDVEKFAKEKDLVFALDDLKKGALLAQKPKLFETMDGLDETDREILRREKTHRWSQPWMMYCMTILCAGSAIVQGMDQSAVNGAQVFYFREFDIQNPWLQGFLNGAPYLCSALVGCWTTKPLNYYFGRRGTIFISCFISFATGIWMAVADSWWNLLLARFGLGLAVGAKSSTTPVYAAECAPAVIRGALTMMWQMWTAFGIMLGFIVSVAFYGVSAPNIEFLNWRLMLGSTSIPPLIVCCLVYLVPESPRWYMTKNKYPKAYDALCRFRPSKLQAARDVYYIHKALEVENEMKEGRNTFKELFTVPRNRRATQSSWFVMFMQQFCGVNVIAYYSTQIFRDAGRSDSEALLFSLGTGIINWVFALPAVYTIDTFGRRNLLLTTFPLMGICLLFTGFSFFIDQETALDARTACIATGIYLFMVVYSPGEGPVPFTYSAEAFPLYVREWGMASATAVTWGFNFILSLTWPALVAAFTPQGAFAWYAAWNFVGWTVVYFFLPETKALTLEELDTVFSVRTRDHAKHYRGMLPYYAKKYLLRRKDLPPQKQLYHLD
ncbi:hypothetical protein FH972_022403 [Carpinus fangiana]|uniref:Major facilitator superfamily (MFS) profile domain-containing protein n=1 Tax=Carpinus fangiana TaxID=176857 RepID=A0A5N6KSP6_9ROSI|nr:hypothetical protein FH972_022403 [Carpinus fangiana]